MVHERVGDRGTPQANRDFKRSCRGEAWRWLFRVVLSPEGYTSGTKSAIITIAGIAIRFCTNSSGGERWHLRRAYPFVSIDQRWTANQRTTLYQPRHPPGAKAQYLVCCVRSHSTPPRPNPCVYHLRRENRWGFFMMAAIAAQLGTGWLRAKALEGKHSNFSVFHRVTINESNFSTSLNPEKKQIIDNNKLSRFRGRWRCI